MALRRGTRIQSSTRVGFNKRDTVYTFKESKSEIEQSVRQSAVDQFQELLAPPPLNLAEPDLDIIQSLPPNVDYEHLCVAPEAEEIRRAVFSISGDSTPGPDGFTAVFFQKCWKIMERDMTDAVAKFFGGAYLPRSVTSTSIVLITKKETPVVWADYRPISLCNVTNKIITKILMARLAPLLSLVISPNQSGFVKGRLLNDNVLLGPWRKFSERVQRIRAPKLLIQRRSKPWDTLVLAMVNLPYSSHVKKTKSLLTIWAMQLSENSPVHFQRHSKYKRLLITSSSFEASHGSTSTQGIS